MPENDKSLKDTKLNQISPYRTSLPSIPFVLSYTKTNKLIMALYMVTDIIDGEEPMRAKLRTLGLGVISDIYLDPKQATQKISELMSFLAIASTVGIISEMNHIILKKEFLALDQSIKDYLGPSKAFQPLNLGEFFAKELPETTSNPFQSEYKSIGHGKIKTISKRTRVGVQKAGDLMQVLSDKTSDLSNTEKRPQKFNMIRIRRRNDIMDIVKNNGGLVTIKDIKIKRALIESLANCGEKTLQRELLSMVKDGILDKNGKKRWSKYTLASIPK